MKMRLRLLFLTQQISFEPALIIAMLARAWQSVSGILTLLIVLSRFDAVTQGYYQTFVSLVALQWFVELGAMVAIVSVVSHEWAYLSIGDDGRVQGVDRHAVRLGRIARFVISWFALAALGLLLVGGGVGVTVLARQGNSATWLLPWVGTIMAASAFLFCQGLIALIEGCSQVLPVATYRLIQAVIGAIVLWIAVISGAGLWSLAMMTTANLLCAGVFLVFGYRRFLGGLLRDRRDSDFAWRRDIWPMQWSLALQGVTGYFMFALFVPVIYSYRGVIEAGRMGLSLQVVTAILGFAATFLTVKAPKLGAMYARGDVSQFTATWKAASINAVAFALAGTAIVMLALMIARGVGVAKADRFLPPLAFALLLGWGVLAQVMQAMATYWRAQRLEAVGIWGVVPGLVTGPAVWWCGRQYGTVGAAGAAMAVAILVTIPLGLFFLRKSIIRTEYQSKSEGERGGDGAA